ncbi:MAG: energy-coupling factor transporter transmembrane component T [Chloroflexota bacterium]|nr:energy-coupling factor transporter transmembrane component T [Chloroflexota bacterium]
MHKLAYQPGFTMIHRLYPITKFAWLIIGSLLVFIINNGVLLISLACILLLILHLINRGIWNVRGFRLTISTGLLLLILYLVFDKSGQMLFDTNINFLTLTSGGLNTGLRVSGRFLVIVFLSYLLILTTDPNHLAYALMKVGLPYHYGFMLVTALRLTPLMEEEGRTIYRAQLVRGIHYDRSNISKLFLIVRQFMTPLLISALRRADKLVFSLEGRGFGKYPKRTFRTQTNPTTLDITVSFILSLFFAMLLIVNYGGLF